jgi:hypothetical protein
MGERMNKPYWTFKRATKKGLVPLDIYTKCFNCGTDKDETVFYGCGDKMACLPCFKKRGTEEDEMYYLLDGQTRYQWMPDGTIQPIGKINENAVVNEKERKKDQRGLYAAIAMQGILANPGTTAYDDNNPMARVVAVEAVRYADALIKELEK